MKKKRHEVILRIIETNSIFTQTELLEKLNEEGFETTQATVSRDIKDLRLVKKPDQYGRSCYAVDKSDKSEISGKFNSVFAHSVISSDSAGNMLVIKCYNGMANAACAALDVMEFEGVVGTLAGDDTIFVLCRTIDIADKIKAAINEIIVE
ncbi:MAG: arginine repressor [Clostridia bacterium]|jgi:transcriptional regulator of arginine metabolism|nr:arginine repressor [Clostridia bacterium]MBR6702502.1 arginine repressor [Clostridia bacterium]